MDFHSEINELNWIELNLWATQAPSPKLAKNAHHEIYEKLVFICSPLLYICLLCDEVSLSWKFGNPEFDVSPPPPPKDPPNIYIYLFSYFGFEFKKLM